MVKYVVYDNTGKCCGYFLPGEKNLAELWVSTYGGYYREINEESEG